MAERHHVKTVPGEHVAPEYPEGGVHVVEGGHAQSDDINVAFVAVMVLMFAVFLLVSLIGLQAMYYHQTTAEEVAKQAPQGGSGTVLGQSKAKWDTMLHASGPTDQILSAPKLDSNTGKMVYGTQVNVVPIDKAMENVVKKYEGK